MPGPFLRELDGVERRSVSFLEKQQIAAFVDDANGHFHVPFLGFRFGRGDHRLDGGQVQIFFGGKIGSKSCCCEKSEHSKK